MGPEPLQQTLELLELGHALKPEASPNQTPQPLLKRFIRCPKPLLKAAESGALPTEAPIAEFQLLQPEVGRAGEVLLP